MHIGVPEPLLPITSSSSQKLIKACPGFHSRYTAKASALCTHLQCVCAPSESLLTCLQASCRVAPSCGWMLHCFAADPVSCVLELWLTPLPELQPSQAECKALQGKIVPRAICLVTCFHMLMCVGQPNPISDATPPVGLDGLYVSS